MKANELLQRVIDSGVLAFEQDAPEKLESLEADICEFLKPAAHLTIPGALEWDGDNGTHGADGESRAHGESAPALAIVDESDDGLFIEILYGEDGSPLRRGDKLYGRPSDRGYVSKLAYEAAQKERDDLRAQLANTEQSRRSFFDLSQDLEKRLAEFQRVLGGMLFAYDDGVGRDWSAPLLDHARTLCPAVEFVPIHAKCESCGDWGHIEIEDSAHDCPECGPSVVERAVEAGVMNAPKPYVAMTEAEADEFLSSFGGGSGNKAKRRIAAIEAAKAEPFPCWNCSKPVTMGERAAADGDCPHCGAELDLEDWPTAKSAGGCAYEVGDWQCREGGYLWDAGTGEGYDPEDCTHICPHCRTKDYLEAAKDEAESCSSYSNNGSSGTGLDIWTSSERTALEANRPEALKAMAELGPVSALDGDEVVICNTQHVKP